MSTSARFVLVALCLILAACDSAEPEAPPSPLVGSWTLQTVGSDTYATLSRPQTALDPFTPAKGEVRVEGAFSRKLLYVTSRSVNDDFGETVVSYTLASAPYPVPDEPLVVLNGSARWANISVLRGLLLQTGGSSTGYFLHLPTDTPPVSQSGDTLRIGPNVYDVDYPGSGSVTAEGTLVLPRRQIEAGVETRMSQAASIARGISYTSTIRADGTFVDQGEHMAPQSGTWSVGPDSTVTFSLDRSSTTRRYRITGSMLRLESTEPFDCDAGCRTRVEDAADVSAGTVQRARLVFVSTFARVRS